MYLLSKDNCMYNPVMQGKILSKYETGLNVGVGLCRGHDSMFYKYSQAIVMALMGTGRVLGYNPANAFYTANTYQSK